MTLPQRRPEARTLFPSQRAPKRKAHITNSPGLRNAIRGYLLRPVDGDVSVVALGSGQHPDGLAHVDAVEVAPERAVPRLLVRHFVAVAATIHRRDRLGGPSGQAGEEHDAENRQSPLQ